MTEPATGPEARDDEREGMTAVVTHALYDAIGSAYTDAVMDGIIRQVVERLDAAGYRKNPEPEWEYGETNGMQGVWPIRPDVSPELWANTPVDRRRKRVAAGPWVPVGEGEQG